MVFLRNIYKPLIFPEEKMAKQVAKAKVRKKKWFPVIAPGLFREQVIGEIHLYESSAMKGRSMNVNMMNLTGNPRNQQINVLLRITDVKEGKGLTEVLGYEMMPSGVRRIVRRGRTKVGDSVVVATSDNKKVRIKPLLVTNTNANKSAAKSIRLGVRNALASFVSKLTYDQLVEEIMTFKLQKYLGNNAAKIAPIRSSEIRAFKLVEKEGVRVLKPKKIEEPEKKDEVKKEEAPPKKEEAKEEKKVEEKVEEKKEVKKEEKEEKTEEKKEAEEKKEEKKADVKEEKKEELGKEEAKSQSGD